MTPNLRLACALSAAFLTLGSAPAGAAPDASALYGEHCAACHGPNMEGGQGASFIDGIWNYGSAPGQHRRNIAFGIIGTQMVAYDQVLTDPEIDAVHINTQDLFDAALTLNPEKDAIHVKAIKGTLKDEDEPALILDPATMLIRTQK